MALKLRFDVQAEQDLREIREYLVREAGADSADRVRQHLRQPARPGIDHREDGDGEDVMAAPTASAG